jgi:hypothetical protein
MRTWIDVPSVSHPGYVHPAGSEARILFMNGAEMGVVGRPGRERMIEIDALAEDGTVAWSESFLLPPGMRVDRSKPPIILPQPAAAANPTKPSIRTRPSGRR